MEASRAKLLGLAGVGMVAIATAIWLPFNAPYFTEGTTVLAVFAAEGVLWLIAAVVSLARHPASPLWKLILAYLLLSWLVWALQYQPNPVLQGLALTFAPTSIAVFVHVLVAFPSGQLRTRFDREVVEFVYLVVVGLYLLIAATWQMGRNCEAGFCPVNVLLVWPNDELREAVSAAGGWAVPIVGVLVVYAIWRHWNAAGIAARRALLPVVITVPIFYVADSVGALSIEPLATIFREYHAVELALYAIPPVGLLLGVLRLRLDRGRVAGLVVELGRGIPAGGLRDVLARALGDPTLQLAFAAPHGGGYIDGAGRAIQVTSATPDRAVASIERNGQPLAVIVHDRTIDDEDPGLVEAVSSAARLAIENEQLTAQVRSQLEEVRASRARIVQAGDEQRRKVERDLHDGAQQRLVALAMRLERARSTTQGSTQLIDETTAELREAIAEVRGLARGLYPPILTEGGLAAAVESLVERMPIPVEVQIPDTRFPAVVEVAAYFVVAEALANVARHSGASSARVQSAVIGNVLTITVTDDGQGGADPATGTGLRGLADRVAAVGGSFEVESSGQDGTKVRAELALDEASP